MYAKCFKRVIDFFTEFNSVNYPFASSGGFNNIRNCIYERKSFFTSGTSGKK